MARVNFTAGRINSYVCPRGKAARLPLGQGRPRVGTPGNGERR